MFEVVRHGAGWGADISGIGLPLPRPSGVAGTCSPQATRVSAQVAGSHENCAHAYVFVERVEIVGEASAPRPARELLFYSGSGHLQAMNHQSTVTQRLRNSWEDQCLCSLDMRVEGLGQLASRVSFQAQFHFLCRALSWHLVPQECLCLLD